MLHYAWRTCTCRIQQNFVEAVRGPGLPGDIFFQILVKKCHVLQPIINGIVTPFLHQRRHAFNTHHAVRPFCQRQGKVTHSAEQIEHPVLRLNIQPGQCGGYHLLVNTIIDLNEIARAER